VIFNRKLAYRVHLTNSSILALRDALRMREPTEIRRIIRLINNNPHYLYHMQHDVIEAERVVDQLERMMWFKRSVLHMDKNVSVFKL
jgi:hypothetical protein